MTIILGRLTPVLIGQVTKKIERIAIIGEFTPSNLPLSIQRELSMGLTTLASDGSPMPGIATSWTIEDGGKRFTFRLGERTWHDGNQVKARDINYNIAGVTFNPLDDMTIQAILPEPYSPFPFLVSKPILQVGLKGVGMYKVEQIKLRQGRIEELRIIPVRNALLPIKQYHVYKTESLAFLAYKRGTVDRVEDVSSPAIF
ncbi:MAG: hypothetical protein N3A54_05040, partial [Patescibacteria group bacterium]|nr:hypothetical protein [Patescibacteria group bacterium]